MSIPDYLHTAFEAIGAIFVAAVAWRGLVHLYYRRVAPPRAPREYGKWAIVTGSTSGIGKEFAEHLAGLGMSILLISRSEEKLVAQKDELKALIGKQPGFGVLHLAYDFTDMGPARATFYQALEELCDMMHRDGGIGLLVNNVGTVHYHPQTLAESSAADIDAMLNCNMNSVVYMSKTVARFMADRKSGCVISISSASGTSPNPYISIYSATK
jgi:17beta-estradiol 17-dehydrogenase / very-long-chain 3-oxoacyl-CoA reductase